MPMSVDALTGALCTVPAELLLRGSEELVSDIMRRLVCGCWSAGAGLRVLVCGLCRRTLC